MSKEKSNGQQPEIPATPQPDTSAEPKKIEVPETPQLGASSGSKKSAAPKTPKTPKTSKTPKTPEKPQSAEPETPEAPQGDVPGAPKSPVASKTPETPEKPQSGDSAKPKKSAAPETPQSDASAKPKTPEAPKTPQPAEPVAPETPQAAAPAAWQPVPVPVESAPVNAGTATPDQVQQPGNVQPPNSYNPPTSAQTPYDPNQVYYGQPVQAPPYQGQAYQGQPGQGQPYQPQPFYAQPTAAQGPGSNKALVALICGIAAIVTSGLVLPGLIFGVIAIVFASKYVKSFGKDAKATGAKITGIVGIGFSVIAMVAYIFIGIIAVASINAYEEQTYTYTYTHEDEADDVDDPDDSVLDDDKKDSDSKDDKPSSEKSELGKRTNPLKLGESITLDFTYYEQDFKTEIDGTATISISEVIRGDEAYEILLDNNKYNEPAPDGQEWVLFKTHFTLKDGSEDDPYLLMNNFTVIDSNGSEVSQKEYATLERDVAFGYVELYKGGKSEGYVGLLVPKGDDSLVAWNDFTNKVFFSLSK